MWSSKSLRPSRDWRPARLQALRYVLDAVPDVPHLVKGEALGIGQLPIDVVACRTYTVAFGARFPYFQLSVLLERLEMERNRGRATEKWSLTKRTH